MARLSRFTRALALTLASLQVLAPTLSQAATTYELRKTIPNLTVKPSTGGSTGNTGSTGGSTGGNTGGTDNNSGSGTTPPPTLTGIPSLSSSSLSFASVSVGQTSSSQTLQLTNVGNAALTLSSLPSTTGDFAATTNCGSSLGISASCQISVTFQPTAEGSRSGLVTLQTSEGTVSASLSGTGFVPLAKATWESTTLSFGGVPVGSSLTKTVKLHNTGNVSGSWTSLTALPSGVTADASNCSSVAAGSSCTVSFTYAPTSGAAYAASGVVPASGTSTNALSISGQGLTTQVSFSAGSLLMASTDVGATSASRSVLLVNEGNTEVSIGSLTVSGPFNATTSCGTTLAVAGTCQVDVTFSPTAMGPATGSLSLGTGAGAQTVDLSGTGLQYGVSVSPTSLTWSPAAIDGASSSLTAVVTNTGNKTLKLGTPALTGSTAHSLTTTCTSTLNAGATCNLTVLFAPQSVGTFTGNVAMTTSASTVNVGVSGQGVLAAQTLTAFVDSGYQWVYRSASATYPLAQALCAGTINGTTDWQVPTLTALTAVRTSQGVSGLQSQGWPMAAGIWYWTSDAYQTNRNYVLNNSGQSWASTLDGTVESLVCARPVAAATLTSASNGAFPAATVGSTVTQTVTLTNSGSLALTGVTPTATGSGVSVQSTTCTSTLNAGASCTVTLAWTPTSSGALSNASLSVASSAANGAVAQTLTGTAAGSGVSFLMHADTALADDSSTGLTVTATGTAAVASSPARVGTGALTLNGSGSYVTVGSSSALGFGTGDFTMEAWVYMNGAQLGSAAVLDLRASGASTQVKPTIFASSGNLSFYANGWRPTGMSTAPSLNAWHHVAYSRTAGVGRFFVDGVKVGNDYADTLDYGATSDMLIGQVGDNRSYSAGYFKGSIDEVRVTKGLGRYTANFTPSPTTGVLSSTAPTFADTAVGATSAAVNVTLTNAGPASVNVSSVTTNNSEFTVGNATACTNAALPSGSSCTVTVQFVPSTSGARSGVLTVASDASTPSLTVNLSGNGLTSPDPYNANVTAYLRFEGANGTSTLTDASPSAPAVSVYQGVTNSSTLVKSGAGSGAFAGNGYAYYAASANHDITSGDFTVEAWVYPTAAAHRNMIAVQRPSSGTSGWNFAVETTGKPRFWMTGGTDLTSTGSAPLNTWTHVAAVRYGTSLTLYVNGVAAGTATVANGVSAATTGLRIGSDEVATSQFTGYMDDVRLTKGVARYTSGFTAGASGDVYASGVKLLQHMDGNGTDAAGHTVTQIGSAITFASAGKFSTAANFAGTASGPLAGCQAVVGSTLEVARTGTDFELPSGDFTAELWIKPTTVSGSQGIFSNYESCSGIRGWNFQLVGNKPVVNIANGTNDVVTTFSTAISAGVWTHLALVKSGTSVKLFVNGVQDATVGTYSTYGPTNTSTTNMRVGNTHTVDRPYNGQMDEIRLTKGTARYSTNFTPAAAAFTYP